jgi:hypothetical protein
MWKLHELVGRDGILRPIVNRPSRDEAKASKAPIDNRLQVANPPHKLSPIPRSREVRVSSRRLLRRSCRRPAARVCLNRKECRDERDISGLTLIQGSAAMSFRVASADASAKTARRSLSPPDRIDESPVAGDVPNREPRPLPAFRLDLPRGRAVPELARGFERKNLPVGFRAVAPDHLRHP